MTDDRIYKLLKLMVSLMGRLPTPALTFLSDLFGLIWYGLDKRHRTVVQDNLNLAYPGVFSRRGAERMAVHIFKNTAAILFEVIWAYPIPREKLFAHFTVKGGEHLEAARKKGRGVLLLTCHMGNFELLVAALPKAGVEKPYGIYRKFDFKPLERLMREMRQRFGATLIPMRGASEKIDAVLREGGEMGTLLDQNVDWYKGVFVDFFGRPACTNSGFAKLALRSRAPVVPMYTVRKGKRFLIEFLPEVPLIETGDKIKDIEINTQNYVSAVESMVRRYPDQYFWVHNRWKTKPYCPYPRA
ncbi:MAG: lauroyl acyltransferase [Desulfobacula sp. RIFOXYA12_FULL_46_16]|nr:MAG: lauroyl acyltransferase [Deltaproteobacteria bacterium RIFOXYC2_FULL_48_10]OGR20492.1 MAG: lauroyl acyltransferase [Desulfobacula sp. RIFOXYA12_FULL_46_16]